MAILPEKATFISYKSDITVMALPCRAAPSLILGRHYRLIPSQWISSMLDAESFVPHRKDTQNVCYVHG